ncbi:hypothetical protein [Thermoplasma volcanium GSS1]|uniref:DUF106 domain-containing protein n=1 Tax=Thermoplasma volcanium (strain ATCC 51530 / DSM 4299 / JCM 9571 / NBRC 15438 / GSS1) TaxID=273116 RepID=Q97BV1_THEVO|nr:DUF106 domain-containing protein [Thermoplasma volcanium]BAB59496.1 hypothetical protein [Thermoplasma volcanium GSS1]
MTETYNKEQQEAMKKMMSFQMLYMLIMLGSLFIVITPSSRDAVGNLLNVVLIPTIGFGYRYPLLSIILTGVIIGVILSIPRYFFTDWVKMGKMQNTMKAFNEAIRAAYRERDMKKINKLNSMRMQMSMDQYQLSMNTMKPLLVISVLTILFYAWLFVFVGKIPYNYIAFPWDFNINISTAHFWIMPYWIFMYFLTEIVVSYFITMIMKYIDFTLRLRRISRETSS